MKNINSDKPGIPPIGVLKRKAIPVSQKAWVKTECLQSENGPLVVRPAVSGLDLISWAGAHREFIESTLSKRGAILFRGFGLDSAEGFERFIKVAAAEPLEYRERSSPRRQVRGHIYTSTEYPADQSIFFHNENSYQRVWPMKLFFFCLTPAEQGGETPIADSRRVLQRLSRSTLDRFDEKQCLYVRNFDDVLGLPWQTVFQTTDRSEVEESCRQANITFEWRENNCLRTYAVRPVTAAHPRTGELVWFNHVAFFHVSTLERNIREGLLATMSEENLPANTYYGDGSLIESWVLNEIREAYRKETISFAWEKGDILLLDNMLMAHSRAPYRGQRKILVAMAEPFGGQTPDRSTKHD